MQTLTTQKIVAIVIGLLVILGGGYALLNMEGDSSMEVAGDGTSNSIAVGEPNPSAPVSPSAKGSFKDLLGKAGAQKCTVSQESDISKSTGVFYVSGGKGRGDFQNTVLSGAGAGTISQTSMIMEGDTIYAWDVSTKQGMKMSMTDMEKNAQPTGTTQAPTNTAAQQFNQSYDYTCENWKVDSTLFTPPTGVVFMDIGELMKGLQGGVGVPTQPITGASGAGSVGAPSGVDMSAMCASCDQAGDGRDACRSALGCN